MIYLYEARFLEVVVTERYFRGIMWSRKRK